MILVSNIFTRNYTQINIQQDDVAKKMEYFSKNKKIEECIKLFNSIQNPNTFLINKMILAYLQNSNESEAIEFYQDIKKKYPHFREDAFTYSTLIRAFCKLNKVSEALETLSKVKTNDVSSYHIDPIVLLLSKYSNHLDQALDLFNKYPSKYCAPVLMNAFADCNNTNS